MSGIPIRPYIGGGLAFVNAEIIKIQVVNTPIMPLGNTTNMQDSERQDLGIWLDQLDQK